MKASVGRGFLSSFVSKFKNRKEMLDLMEAKSCFTDDGRTSGVNMGVHVGVYW